MTIIRAWANWFNRRRRVIALLLMGWAGVVIVAAGGVPTHSESFALPDLGDLLVLGVILLAVSRFAYVLYRRPKLQSGAAPRGPKMLKAWIAIAIAAALLATLFDFEETAEDDAVAQEDQSIPALGATVGQVDDDGAEATEVEIIALVVLAAAAAAVLIRSRRRSGPGGEIQDHQEEPAADLELVIDETTEQLLSPVNPRMAVLAAYATLERALADRGQSRKAAETPTEHMQRVFATVPSLTEPAVRLGRLYELARFSDHPITGADRDLAAEELVEARGSIAAWAGGGR